jgi:SpoVK/Ycf46/Vps4 family AAA+-type ATPase
MNPDESIRKGTRQAAIDLPGVTRTVKPTATWAQLNHVPLALPGLKNVCQEYKPGQGLLCLFTGMRGSSQSLAAQAIAGQLELTLMYADLAALVNKYIGETEKNLDRIFTAAEHQNAVLFFDEADALFGKRSDVKDSHDRYANLEVNYLLQRIEAFHGLAILTSNMKPAQDDALLRRVRHVIDFPH